MKTTLLLIVFLFASILMKAQVWAPSGATWYYSWAQMWVSGYVKIQYIGDSTVGGKSCKVLQKDYYSYDWVNHTYGGGVLGYEYTYFENDIVYYYRFGQFYTLYDFNSNPGSSWVVAGWNENNPCDSSGSIVVNSTGMTNINSFSLKYLASAPGQNSEWTLGDTIVERIGALDYMLPEPICLADVFEGGPLRCYYDDEFGLYQRTGFPQSCDYITGVQDNHQKTTRVKIYPVPTSSTLTIEKDNSIKEEILIEISDIMGNKIRNIESDKTKLEIDVEDLNEGFYFISIKNQKGFIYNQKFIKNVP